MLNFFKKNKKILENNKEFKKIPKPVVLIILDGYGISPIKEGNAVFSANTPNIDFYQKNYPKALLHTAGNEVGLPFGEFGNSEVGHLNIGSGRIVYQPLLRVSNEIESGHLYDNPSLEKLKKHHKKNKSKIHLLGLISAGGVHSHIEHLFSLIDWIGKNNLKNVYLHLFTDGRDSPTKSAVIFIEDLSKKIKELKVDAKIASVSGRYFAMDRDYHWDRTKKSYDCLIGKSRSKTNDIEEYLNDSYKKEITDEFIKPVIICDKDQNPIGPIEDNDAVLFFNIRPDRTRQILSAFINKNFNSFKTNNFKNLLVLTMTQYDHFKNVEVVFPENPLDKTLGEVLSDSGKKQFHIAETEKYAHVTYFFNGGNEKPFKGETRVIIPSPRVPTYDKKPEMSAYKITKRVLEELEKNKQDFYVINFANPDMVGHTGDFKAIVKAIEVVDECLGLIIKKVIETGGATIITADHGNAESVINPETKEKDTEHNIYPAPIMVISEEIKKSKAEESFKEIFSEPIGALADIAPTILDLMNIEKPTEMTGVSLLSSLK